MNLQSFRMKSKPEFMIIPMIDIIFFLLVFFMMNSLQTIAQKALSVQLPQATTASAPAQLPVVLTLDAEGHITIDNVPMSIDAAEAMVKERIAQNPNASVILQADKRSAHGQVVAIMDMLKQAGFSKDNVVLVTDPVYPVYVDSNIMAGREIVYAASNEANGFAALPDENVKADIIYLCSPNNPTGSAYNAEQLKAWVDYALKNDAIILYDSAYEAFITEDLPRSIFAIEGARKCAIEMCSLSKTAGFTGTRCGYTIIPKELERDGHNIYATWYRRQATKFNGVSWPVQCAAAAVFSEEGQKQIKENISYYQENARIIASALDELGIYYTGGKNSPYIWLKCPNNMGSWEFFDLLLNEANVVGTPGEGFGENGAGYFRLTSFGDRENTIEAVERIKKVLTNLSK